MQLYFILIIPVHVYCINYIIKQSFAMYYYIIMYLCTMQFQLFPTSQLCIYLFSIFRVLYGLR